MGVGGINHTAVEGFKTLKVTKGKLNSNQGDDFYLISAKSMPNFITIIQKSDCQNYIDNENDKQSEKDLIKHFKKYQTERISFLTNFVECWRLAEQDIEEENKFIIAEESFCEKMGNNIDRNNIKPMKVDNNKIIFINSDRAIAFTKIDNILYKFTTDGNKSLIIDPSDIVTINSNISNIFNPRNIQNNNVEIKYDKASSKNIQNNNENEKEISIRSSIMTENEVNKIINKDQLKNNEEEKEIIITNSNMTENDLDNASIKNNNNQSNIFDQII